MSKVTPGKLIEAKNELLLAIIAERKLHEQAHHGRFAIDESAYRIREVQGNLNNATERQDERLTAICKYLGVEIVYDGGYLIPKTCRAVKKGKSK